MINMDLRSVLQYRSNGKNVYEIVKNLTIFVKKFVAENFLFQKSLSDLSIILDIPKTVLENRSKQILFRFYQFDKKKFILKNNILFIFCDLVISLGLSIFMMLHIFTPNKNKIRKFDLICENIASDVDVKRHKFLSENFNSTLLLSYKNLECNYENTKSINIKKELFNLVSINFSFKKIASLVLFLIKIFYYSILNRYNFLSVFKYLIYDFIKYKKIYSKYSAKYHFHCRFYDTNPLHNYIFKKSGGLKTSCYQKNLCMLSLSCFVYSDIFFSLGQDQGKICNDLGGEIDFFKPVGSFFMENAWFKQKKDLEKIPDIDVLIIGINAPYPRGCINNDFHNSYYKEFIPWIVKISKEFPNKKIFYKHHSYFKGDVRASELLNNANLKVIVNDKSLNSTYGWAFKSKIIISFGSTMIVELIGNGKQAYFIDPGGINHQWFYGINDLEKYKIKNYDTLKKIVANSSNIKTDHNVQNENFFCISGGNTSKIISNFLKNEINKN